MDRMQYQQQLQQQYLIERQASEQRQMGLFLHLSQLLTFVVPPAGIVVPIVLWQTKKDEMPALDAHGKTVVNWMLSSVVYFALSVFLAFAVSFFVGILGFVALVILGIVFPIVGALKANNGELWEYPLTIKFLK